MPTGKLTSFGLKAVDSDKWDGNIREAIAVAGKDGQKLVLLYNAVVAKAAVDDQVTNSATANYNGGADSEAATTVVKLGFFTMKKIDKQKTAMAFLYFRKMHCDMVVLETGLGGETDATNIVKNTICAAFATISVDHLGVIGDTLEEIARTKSGIIKLGCAVVSARQTDVVRNVLKKKAEEKNCSYVEAEPKKMKILTDSYDGITFSYKEFEKMHSNLAGQCQRENLATALEIVKQLRTLGYEIPDEAVRDGLAKTVWEGRFTCLRKNPVFIIDGAHNEDAAIKLRTSIERYFKGKEIQLIMGVFQDKEHEKITSILCPLAKKVYTVELPNKARSLSAGKLADCARKYCEEAEAKDSIQSAVESATAACGAGMNNQVIIACGSLSYLGEVKRIVEENRKIACK